MPRHYTLSKRAQQLEETRRRIVEATMAVHGEKGILATTLRDIAFRADVAPSTVLAHFPTLESLVTACGRRTGETWPLPTSEIFARSGSLSQRVEQLVEALFAYYEPMPLELIERDREKLPIMDEFLTERERAIHELIVEALRPIGSPASAVATVQALTQFAVWKFLRSTGRSTSRAAATVTAVLNTWLEREASSSPLSREPGRFPSKGA